MGGVGGLDSPLSTSDFWTLAATWAVLTAAALVLLTTYNLTSGGRGGKRLPPGPRRWPIIGNLGLRRGPQLRPHQRFAELAKEYGPIYMLHLGSMKSVVVCSSRYAEEILKTHDNVFASRPRSAFGGIVGYDRQTLGQAPYGHYWRHIRKVFTLELLTAKRLQQFQELRKREILRALQAVLDESEGRKAVCLRKHFRDLTRNNITQMIISKNYFGPNSGASNMKESEEYIKAMDKVASVMAKPIPEDFFPFLRHFDLRGIKQKLKRIRGEVDKVFDPIIEEHRQEILSHEKAGCDQDQLDVVGALLTRPGADAEEPLSDNQVKAILLSIYIGGTETSSAALEWVMAELLKNPPILKRAQDEIDSVVGRDRLVEESDLPRLEYLRAIVKESLRLHPVASILLPHYSMEACEVGEYYIPKNCVVMVNVAAINRDPATWDRALEFYPERFLASSTDLHGHHFDFLPFGSGRRICPGKNLGLVMVEYALAVFLQAASWKLPQGLSPGDIDLTEWTAPVGILATPFEAVATSKLPTSIICADHEPASA